MKENLIDVIIVNWNGKHFLDDCLNSILDQTYKDINVILADNNSRDGSVEYISEKFKNIRIISLEENYGFTGANNHAIRSSSGEFVALINNDAVAHRDWLKESVNCLRSYKDAGICASKIVNFHNPDFLDTAGDIYTKGGVNAKRGLGRKTDTYNAYEYVFGACAAALVYRREMLEEIGLFDDDFFVMCEDVDLSFRAQLSGYKCIYCPKSVVYHRMSATIKDINKVFSYYGQRNLEIVFLKNMPLRLLILHLPMHIVYNLSVFIYFLLKGEAISFMRAKVFCIVNLPSLIKKRRLIQKKRKVTGRYISSLITEERWLLNKIKIKTKALFADRVSGFAVMGRKSTLYTLRDLMKNFLFFVKNIVS